MDTSTWNPWKLGTFGILLVLGTALATGYVVANWSPKPAGTSSATPANWATAQPNGGAAGSGVGSAGPGGAEARPRHAAVPTHEDAAACNRYASGHPSQGDKTWEVAKDALIGGAATAGVGAAAGAIANGGSGAGKGAAIGGLVGAAGGALYGINENRKADAAYRAAYARCMRGHGYAG